MKKLRKINFFEYYIILICISRKKEQLPIIFFEIENVRIFH